MSNLPPGFIETPRRGAARVAGVAPHPATPHVVIQQNGYSGRTIALAIGGGCLGLAVVALLVVLAAHAVLGWPNPSPAPHEGVVVGQTLAPAVSGALADGFEKEAALLDEGKTVAEANKALKDTFDRERKEAFAKIGGPYLDKIVPAESELKDEHTRKVFSEAHRAIAKGLRGAGK